MRVDTTAVGVLIDLDDGHNIPPTTTDHDTEPINGAYQEASESEDSGIEIDAESPVQTHKAKNQARREAFDRFLKAAESSQNSESDGSVHLRKSEQTENRSKIIDDVRRYQQELFERALEENIIAVLDTGSGKTLIACLLVRHILTEELISRSKGRPPRLVFFLANSVHLVQQQARVLANNLLSKPFLFVGDDKAEVWKNREIWSQVIAASTPVVCTPAVLQQCLDAALIRIEQISLLVFDEAHHAKKNHPYSRIIRSHYLPCAVEDRPRVFGMTASPVDSKGNIDHNANDLEELLHCKIVTSADPSMLSFVPKPRDAIWTYRKSEVRPETELYAFLWQRCHFLNEIKKGFIFAKHANSTLGPWCANRVWTYVIGASEHESASIVKRFEQGPAYAAIEEPGQRESILKGLQEAVSTVLRSSSSVVVADSIYLSPKVLMLHKELCSAYASRPETRAIVFVDQRFTAQVLHDCFTQLSIPNLRSGTLLGTAQDSTSLKKQEEFLENFRTGIVNLLFATSVADEGIDIPQCNLCIRFDLYKSPIQYIQSRGRARMKNSVYVHMIEEHNFSHKSEVEYAINSDSYIREYCRNLPSDRLLGRGTKLEKMVARDSSNRSFKTKVEAICDFGNSLLVIARFASSLQYLGAVERESYEEEIDEENNMFRSIVRLPKVSEFDVPGARGEWRSNKQLAKRSAAWTCCFLLRRRGLLDENLNAPFKKVKPENLNARLAVSARKTKYPMKIKPALWDVDLGEIPSRLFVSIISFRPKEQPKRAFSPIGFLTRVPIPQFPSFPIYPEDATEMEVSIESKNQGLAVSVEELDLLTCFTLNGVFLDVFNKSYDLDSRRLSYWLAPLAPDVNNMLATKFREVIDFDALSAIKKDRIKWSSGCQVEGVWTNKFLCDPRNGKFHYFTGNLAPEFSIFDPVPSSIPSISQKGMKSIIDFSDSSWKASKQKYIGATYDADQPVISAELLTTYRNFLSPGDEKGRSRIQCLIAPQPLEVSRLCPEFAASCYTWPAVIHRLESYMIALEGFEKLGLTSVPADLALEAFTKDTEVDDADNQMQPGNQHGMGKNYERLEFIGDSLLKMMTTITVFNRTKCDEEGMHCRRMEILCNRRLFEVAEKNYQLHQYARTVAFNRKTWYPENVVLLKGRGAKRIPQPVKHPEAEQELGMKTIADMAEAIIGAAVTSSKGAANRFDLGIKAVTNLVDSEDHAITSWSEIVDMYEAPEWSLKMNDVQANKLAEQIAAETGYRFRHPRLLRSAFTHSSDVHAPVPDLQRLEFLGDAVLDWVSISWLFDNNPDRNPQWLTEHKMAMVSNKFLAALAVVLNFDRLIYCSTAKLFADITSYSQRVREAFSSKDIDARRDFWTDIDSPPKALSDLIESYLGAVLIDSDFDYGEIEAFFDNHVLWFFEDIGRYDGFANRHPTTYLHKKITGEFKCHDFSIIVSAPEEHENRIEFKVKAGVLIHNKVVADDSGTSAKYARVRASKKALDKLEGMSIEEFRSAFGCLCKNKDG